jgi:hypothetical protein
MVVQMPKGIIIGVIVAVILIGLLLWHLFTPAPQKILPPGAFGGGISRAHLPQNPSGNPTGSAIPPGQ